MKHIILTRFNVPFSTWEHLLTDEWMEERFDIFDNICYPSVEGQTNKNFKWILICDPNTKSEWRKKIDSYELATPVYCDWPKRLKYILEVVGDAQYLITTRLDNDDALNKYTVEEIQKKFDFQKEHYINFPRVIITDGEYYSINIEPSNPFVTLIEERPFKTVWSVKHGNARYSKSIQQNDNIVAGLRIIHGRNASNRMGLRSRLLENCKEKKDFTVCGEFLNKLL